METYVAPYVQVRHAIHLLYATSPRSRDGADDTPADAETSADAEAPLNEPDEPATWGGSDGVVSEPPSVR